MALARVPQPLSVTTQTRPSTALVAKYSPHQRGAEVGIVTGPGNVYCFMAPYKGHSRGSVSAVIACDEKKLDFKQVGIELVWGMEM